MGGDEAMTVAMMDELAAMRARAQKIIERENALLATDSPARIGLFAMRLLRVKTAEEILGVAPP
jgi:hypothetical protein